MSTGKQNSKVTGSLPDVFSGTHSQGIVQALDQHVAIALLDANKCFIHVNEAFCRTIGYDKAELIGKTYPLSAAPKTDTTPWPLIWETLKENGTWKGDVCHKSKEGHRLWLETSLTTQTNTAGHSEGYIVLQNDITKAKIAEGKLNFTLETLKDTSRITRIGSWEYHTETERLYWSDTTKEIHQVPHDYEPNLQEGFEFYEAGPSRDRIQEIIAQSMQSEEYFEEELRIVPMDGKPKWVKVIMHSEIENGQCHRIYGVIQDIEQEKTERLEKEENSVFLNNLLDAATEFSIISTDKDGLIRIFNYGAEKLLGYSRDEVVGKLTPEAFHIKKEIENRSRELSAEKGHNISGFETFTHEANAHGIEVREWTYVCKDGSHVPVILAVTPMQNKSGELIGYLGIARDISIRKDAERSRQESEDRFRSAFEVSGIGMALVGLDGRWIQVNQSICDIIGYSTEEMLTKTFQEITHPEDLDSDLKFLKEALEGTRTHYQMVKRYYHADGHIIWIRLTVALLRDHNHNPVHFVSQLEDITERKMLEEQVSQISDRLAVATRSSGIGIWDWDMVKDTFLWDNQMKVLFDLRESDPDPDFALFRRRIHPDDLDYLEARLKDTLENDAEYNLEFRIRLPNGKIRHIWAIGMALRDASGKPIRMIGTNRDITQNVEQREELARLAEEAKSASKSKSHFLANMSHEIRTPLNGIIGMASLLSDLPENTEEQKKQISIIQNSGHTLLALVNDILDFAKIEAGKLDIEQTEFNLRNVIEESVALAKHKAEEKGLYLKWNATPNCPEMVLGDPNRIRQILINLSTNAIKFTDVGSVRIFADLSEQKDEVAQIRFSVIDTGIGINEDAKEQLFQQFTQADSSTSRKYGGTGLGLAICKELVELMKGEIGVKSDAGVGSVFWFTLPLPVITKPLKTNPNIDLDSSKDTFWNGKQYQILLTEDNIANQMVIQGILKKYGFQIDVANNGIEALEAIRKKRYDLVFMDIQMPIMDGKEACRQIRDGKAGKTNKKIPIVAITAHARKEDRDDCLAMGMDAYVTKPVNKDELVRTIRRLLPDEATPDPTEITSPETKTDSSVKLFDIVDLEDRTMQDKMLAKEVIMQVMKDIQKILPKIEAATKEKDTDALRQLFHSVKGIALNASCTQLAQSASTLEQFARNGELNAIMPQLAEFMTTTEKSLTAMNAYVKH